MVINADKIILTGQKWTDREHFKHTGYPGGQKRISPQELFDRDQTSLVNQAVKGMLPKNKLGRAIFKNLHVMQVLIMARSTETKSSKINV